MSDEDWQAGFAKSLGVFLNGRGIPTPNERGEQVVDDSFYVMFNAHHEPVEFMLPESKWGQTWIKLLETDEQADTMDDEAAGEEYKPGDEVAVPASAFALLRRTA